jgi:8-amino-7-oxononanoate synthase
MIHTKSYLTYILDLKLQNRYRTLPKVFAKKTPDDFLDFSSNDYLQFSKFPPILKASFACAEQYGLGSTGSRLLSGHNVLFDLFEQEIAQCKKTDKALLFNSGFQANISVLSALLDQKHFNKKPLVFFDKFNHKSLYEAVKLSGAMLIRYAHNDMSHLNILLKKYAEQDNPKFIVSESLYGMDGDVVNLESLIILAKQHSALLYLDEAHATGVLGEKGYGLSTRFNLKDVEHVIMGTFSKALGGAGAYVACSEIVYQYLMNTCSGFIYSTASSPMMIGAMMKAWALLPHFQSKVIKMLELANYLRVELKKLRFETGDSQTHIVPIIFSCSEQALKLKNKLAKNNIFVSFVQYPTVPKNQPRIRIALNIYHDKKNIDKLLSILFQEV